MPDTTDLAQVIRDYQSKSSSAEWAAIGPFVIETATLALPYLAYRPRRVIHALCNLARACDGLGWPLETKTVLRREIIDFVVAGHMPNLSAGSQAVVRPILLRVAEAIGPEGTPQRLMALTGSTPSQPYSNEALGELAWWARTQSGQWRCGSALALVALGAGAGLSSSELMLVRCGDLVPSEAGTTVNVAGPRARQVPLLARWERTLEDACSGLGEDDWVFRPGPRGHHLNLVTNFISRSAGAEHLRPNVQRLRSTWLVHHLSRGTHTAALVKAAGLTTLESLNRFLPFAGVPTAEQMDAELRDAR